VVAQVGDDAVVVEQRVVHVDQEHHIVKDGSHRQAGFSGFGQVSCVIHERT
jgi:hypothetical protein